MEQRDGKKEAAGTSEEKEKQVSAKEFQDLIFKTYVKNKIPGIFIVIEGNQFHFSHVDVGPGAAVDICKLVTKEFMKKLQEEEKA
jgi:hypothetical protein